DCSLPQPGPAQASGPITFRRLSDGVRRARLDGIERLRVGLHLFPQAFDQRRQALDIEREAAEEPAPAPRLLCSETPRFVAPGCEVDGARAFDRERPAVFCRLEGIEQASRGARLGRERATLRSEEDTRSSLRAETPADRRGLEVATVSRPPGLVGECLLG